MVVRHNPLSKVAGFRLSRRKLLKTTAAGASAAVLVQASGGMTGLASAASKTGPSTTTAPYVVPSRDGVDVTSILTVGDSVGGYRMVGIPDGLGAFSTGRTFNLVSHHELSESAGAVRSHGSKGAFVSSWVIDKQTLQVMSGKDHTANVNKLFRWDKTTKKYISGSTVALNRLCSADLPEPSALRHGNLGTPERIFLGGEEFDDGPAWAHILTGVNAGESWQLPRLGRISWENVVACPHSKEKTVAMGMDDGALSTDPIPMNNPSEVYVYVGQKQANGSPIERAGLTNGKLYAIRVMRTGTYVRSESNEFGLGDSTTGYVKSARFELAILGADGDVSDLSGPVLSADAIAHNTTRFQRPEDGAWDPRNRNGNDFYFVTTADINSNSRLWRLRFDDILNPELGGTIEILLTNTAGRMFDNICIDKRGRLLIQEDAGNQPYVSKIRLYGIDTGTFVEIAHHDEELFVSGVNPAKFVTQDEESSGIIDAEEMLGPGWFIGSVQVHKANPDSELVEMGQYFALYVDPKIA